MIFTVTNWKNTCSEYSTTNSIIYYTGLHIYAQPPAEHPTEIEKCVTNALPYHYHYVRHHPNNDT